MTTLENSEPSQDFVLRLLAKSVNEASFDRLLARFSSAGRGLTSSCALNDGAAASACGNHDRLQASRTAWPQAELMIELRWFCREDSCWEDRKPDGGALHPDVVRTMFDRRVKRSGIRRIRFHDLRHTHATIALRAGVPVKVMSERLGLSTPAFTLQQYAHVIPGMQAEASEAISNLIFRPVSPGTES